MAKRYAKKAELARGFGCSLPTINKHTSDPDCPGGQRGPWNHDDFAAFLALKNSPVVGAAAAQPTSSTAKMEATARALLKQEQYRERKRKNDEADGRLMPREEVRREVAAWAVTIRAKLQGLADRIVAVVPGAAKATVKKIVQDVVRLVIKEAYESKLAGGSVRQMILDEAERLNGGNSDEQHD